MKPTLFILAAGMGSRFGGLKQVTPVGPSGETIIEYSIFDAIRAGFGKVVFVIRNNFAEAFREKFDNLLKGRIDVDYVFQELEYLSEGFSFPEGREKPWGTAHAILMGKDVIKEPFAAINADDFYGFEAYKVMADFLVSSGDDNVYSMVGYQLNKTLSEFGTVSRGICETDKSGTLTYITERHKIGDSGNGITFNNEENNIVPLTGEETVSMNFWGFKPSLFKYLEPAFTKFLEREIRNPKSEIYIPNVVFDLIREEKVYVKVLNADSPWFGVTYKEDQPFVVKQIKELVKKGIYPENLWK
ncbi:MAG: NTP transferase domain-containing protein [Prolixibacteraceae bacterium]|nr:NTP transferase domain-containing protein [Prolixibacteraceae bacterium]MBN2775882.1 NTP transferase domain-containing protein [Prolixibacteraceae bacterium]